jgi:TDG/mug DNA glycosylase family protein
MILRASQPPRLLPERAFPSYAFVPGRFPHPVSDPRGHSFGQQPGPTAPLDPERWQQCREYLWALDLFNAGYYWEAHEGWESLWHAAGRTGTTAAFLKGLIKLAAAGVKVREGKPQGVVSHAGRARDLFRQTAAALGGETVRFCGLLLSELLAFATQAAATPAIARDRDLPAVEIVFPFVVLPPWKPSKVQLAAAVGKTVPDVLAEGLDVLFCGINPSLYSAAVGHHFARPGNRFWPALHASGFTERLLSPFDDAGLLQCRLGLTNLVVRATAAAAELSDAELKVGGQLLEVKVQQYRPRVVAFLGVTAYRTAFALPDAGLGRQARRLADAVVWVLPNPSGLNAHYRPKELARLFGKLRRGVALC